MKKKIITFLLTLCSIIAFAQVGINTELPNPNTALHISETYSDSTTPILKKGFIIPRLTQVQIDSITYTNPAAATKTIKLEASDNGLFVFNLSTESYDFWSAKDKTWKKLSGLYSGDGTGEGDLGLAKYNDIVCADITVNGTYYLNQSVDNDKKFYLTIPIQVTKKGTYIITVTSPTGVGVSYVASGVFLDPGKYTIKAYAQGTPKMAGQHELSILLNGKPITENGTTCKPKVEILDPAVITPPDPEIRKKMRILTLARYNNTRWETQATTTFKRRNVYNTLEGFQGQMINCPTNFGTYPESTIKFPGWEEWYCYSETVAEYQDHSKYKREMEELINGTPDMPPVDIIILHNDFSQYFLEQALTNYIRKGGVVIMYSGNKGSNLVNHVFSNIFNDPNLKISEGNYSGTNQTLSKYLLTETGYSLKNVIDPTLVGPFGDVRNTYWFPTASYAAGGKKYYYGAYLKGLPLQDIVVLSQDVKDADKVLAFRHKKLNIFWMGDDRFISDDPSESHNMQLVTKAPLPTTGSIPRYGSAFYLNTIAWALNAAQTTGINAK